VLQNRTHQTRLPCTQDETEAGREDQGKEAHEEKESLYCL